MWDKFLWWLAWKLPKRLVYLCAVRVVAYATQGVYSDRVVPALTAFAALEIWERDHADR